MGLDETQGFNAYQLNIKVNGMLMGPVKEYTHRPRLNPAIGKKVAVPIKIGDMPNLRVPVSSRIV